MDTNFAFNMGLMAVAIVLGLTYLFWLRVRNQVHGDQECDPQLMVIHRFLNESIIELLEKCTGKLADHFETEYDDNYTYLREQLSRQVRLATDYNAWCGSVSCHPGWCVFVSQIKDNEGSDDLYTPWVLTLKTGVNEQRDFTIPFNNVAYLIDSLTLLNDQNELLVRIVKESH